MKNALSEYAASDAFEQKYLFCVQEESEESDYITLARIPSHNSSTRIGDSSIKRKRDTGREDVKENEMEIHGETRQWTGRHRRAV